MQCIKDINEVAMLTYEYQQIEPGHIRIVVILHIHLRKMYAKTPEHILIRLYRLHYPSYFQTYCTSLVTYIDTMLKTLQKSQYEQHKKCGDYGD